MLKCSTNATFNAKMNNTPRKIYINSYIVQGAQTLPRFFFPMRVSVLFWTDIYTCTRWSCVAPQSTHCTRRRPLSIPFLFVICSHRVKAAGAAYSNSAVSVKNRPKWAHLYVCLGLHFFSGRSISFQFAAEQTPIAMSLRIMEQIEPNRWLYEVYLMVFAWHLIWSARYCWSEAPPALAWRDLQSLAAGESFGARESHPRRQMSSGERDD
jgi:hypothetical protein